MWRSELDTLRPFFHQSETLTASRYRPKPQEQAPQGEEKKRPRKLDMRLNGGAQDQVAFSAPFLDNTLQKMMQLQNRMLTTTADLSKSGGVEEKVIKEQAAQSAELSKIIALICAEKVRLGVPLKGTIRETC